jgi:hypothetical protein
MPIKPTKSDIQTIGTEDLCDLLGITKQRLGQLPDGVVCKVSRNTYDLFKSVKGYVTLLQGQRVYGASGNAAKSDIDTGDAHELEELVRQVKAARTYNDARTLKVQIDALRSGYALEVEQNKYCSIDQIEDGMDAIASVVRNAIKRMEGDLPPMLEGLTASAMKKLIGEQIAKVIQIIYDEGERLKAPAQQDAKAD